MLTVENFASTSEIQDLPDTRGISKMMQLSRNTLFQVLTATGVLLGHTHVDASTQKSNPIPFIPQTSIPPEPDPLDLEVFLNPRMLRGFKVVRGIWLGNKGPLLQQQKEVAPPAPKSSTAIDEEILEQKSPPPLEAEKPDTITEYSTQKPQHAKLLNTLTLPEKIIPHDIAVSPDGQWIVTIHEYDVTVHSTKSDTTIPLNKHVVTPQIAAFEMGGTLLRITTGKPPSSTLLFDVRNNFAQIRADEPIHHTIPDIEFLSNGNIMTAQKDLAILRPSSEQLFLKHEEPQSRLVFPSEILKKHGAKPYMHTDRAAEPWETRDIAVSPDQKYIAATNSDKTLRLWDIDTQKLIRRIPNAGDGFMVLSPKDIAACVNTEKLPFGTKETLKFLDLDDDHAKTHLGEMPFYSKTMQLVCLENGKFLRLGVINKGNDTAIKTFTIDAIHADSETLSRENVATTNQPISKLVIDEKGNVLFTTVNGEVLETLEIQHKDPFTKETAPPKSIGATFTPDGTVSAWKITLENIENLFKKSIKK